MLYFGIMVLNWHRILVFRVFPIVLRMNEMLIFL
jgi:hypothetical protein